MEFLKFAMADLNLSARAYDHILKVGRTIDINAQDKAGHTPLKRAILYEQPAVAELLRNFGGKE